ncbi:helix-turn-helix domain-containing protein [Kribbella sp. NPDC004875]|uniref:AraC-like ligand-binding domain-containing protein n=1 Tax=Kribbella sp. NPDC004875 TaxID=3364107 RepID=UPI003690EAF8
MSGADAFLDALATSGLPPLRGRRHEGEDFRADLVTRELGPLRLAELVTPEGECFRDARSARDADSELWQIELVTRGRVRVEQGGSTAVLGPADLALIDPARPVRFSSSATTHVTMLIPRRSLRRRLERCRAELAGTDRPVAAIAASWGFADPAHFSRLFKATYGYNAVTLRPNNRAQMVNASPAWSAEDGA